MSSLILLEPYRSALTAEGIDTGLVNVSKGVDLAASPSYQIGCNKQLQRRVRELCIFYDEVMIIHSEKEGNKEELETQGYQVMSALRMRDHGIVSFPEVSTDPRRLQKLKENMHQITDWWKIEKEMIDTWKPLISSQIVARGKLPDQSLFDVLYANRVEDEKLFADAIAKVPDKWKGYVPTVLRGYKPPGFDFIAISTLNELLSTESVVAKHNSDVAIDKLFGNTVFPVVAGTASGVVRIAIESLLEEELRFPYPKNLLEMTKLRDKESMASFREVFNPWLKKLALGDEDEARLRKEVKKAIRQFRNYPRLSLASDVAAVIAIPVGLAGPVGGIAGAILGLSSMGLNKLAARWQTETRWVGLCPERAVGA